MGNINIRTDLAVELNEAVDKSDSRYSGVIVREHIDKVSLVKVTTLEIINEEGEKLFNRKAGIYITIEYRGMFTLDRPCPALMQNKSQLI